MKIRALRELKSQRESLIKLSNAPLEDQIRIVMQIDIMIHTLENEIYFEAWLHKSDYPRYLT